MKLLEQLKNRNVRIGIGIVTIVLLAQIADHITPTKPSTAITQESAKCVSAGGVIWTGVRLYENSSCSKAFASVMGGSNNRNGQRMVKIKFDSGDVEWKNREAVASQAFVMSNDPAISLMRWQEFLD